MSSLTTSVQDYRVGGGGFTGAKSGKPGKTVKVEKLGEAGTRE